MQTRGVIEQAKGILAERLGVDPEAAFGYLRRLSQNANVRVVDVAGEMVGAARAGGSPAVSAPTGTEHPSEIRPRDVEHNIGERLAVHRIHLAAEQAHADELRRLLYPAPEQVFTDGPLTILARHAATRSINYFRGDFYAITAVMAGAVVAVGDVFGSGIAAANTTARLRHGIRVLGLAGLGPAEMLALLNRELNQDEDPPLASLVLARFGRGDRGGGEPQVVWAQAGHFAPVLVRSGRVRSLHRPPGPALGLLPNAPYRDAVVRLRPADLLILYTDGVLVGQDGEADPVRQVIRGFGAALRDGGPAALMDRWVRPAEDEACVVAAGYHT
jgi:hypothetical protein